MAGAKVADLLGAKHVRAVLSKAQIAKAIESLERALAREGISAASLRASASSALTPQSVNLLELLGRAEG